VLEKVEGELLLDRRAVLNIGSFVPPRGAQSFADVSLKARVFSLTPRVALIRASVPSIASASVIASPS
jgi:hypothetical protein